MDEKRKVILAGASVIFLIILAVIIYMLFFSKKAAEEPPVQPASQKQAVAEKKPAEEPLERERIETLDISLSESDGAIQDRAKAFSANPEFARWLLTKDILRKFTAAVDNIANGESPRKHISFFETDKDFKVEFKGGMTTIDPASFARYDPVADAFASLDTGGCIRLFQQLKPAIQEAYRDLGYPDADFQVTLKKAIAHLLQVPVPEKEIEVEKKVITYTFKDAHLENMSEAQKHLFRMGPANVRKIQEKLREFDSGIGD